ERRLRYLAQHLGLISDPVVYDTFWQRLKSLPMAGIRLEPTQRQIKPGTVSLADACQAADDFVFLWTTRNSVNQFLAQFDFGSLGLDFLTSQSQCDNGDRTLAFEGSCPRCRTDSQTRLLMMPSSETRGLLVIYDDHWRRRLELQVPSQHGYEKHAGIE